MSITLVVERSHLVDRVMLALLRNLSLGTAVLPCRFALEDPCDQFLDERGNGPLLTARALSQPAQSLLIELHECASQALMLSRWNAARDAAYP